MKNRGKNNEKNDQGIQGRKKRGGTNSEQTVTREEQERN